jgi:predicted ATPase/class 3 adenylate cyclase
MYCKACGADNASTARFCLSCGGGLTERCSHCAAELPAGAHFCPACGKPTSPPGPATGKPIVAFPTDERKQVTVLFADFSGFTTYAEKLDPEEVRDRMITLWNRLDAVVKARGGTVEKHIGDAIMAVFGAAQAREDDPQQAVRAGLEMQSALSEGQQGGNWLPLRMRVGIHTGLVVVGPLGNTGEFAATGDTVNLANRLEQNTPPGRVLISHDTYRQVYGSFDVQSLPPLSIRNRPEPLQTYLVLRARSQSLARTLRGVEGVGTETIGREPELKRLQSAFTSVIEERELQVFTVVGEAGIGKTRLASEFRKWGELLPESIRLFCGRATSEMAGLPFSLMRDVFASRFEIQESDPPPVAREKLEKGLLGLVGAMPDAQTNSVEEQTLRAHFIGQLLGLDFSASPYLKDLLQDVEQIRHRAFHYLAEFFTLVSKGNSAGPGSATKAALLILEDIHCSDDGSLDLIDHLARTCQDAPLMIICLARPLLFERRPAWGEGLPAHTRLNLEPLSRRDSRKLVEMILRKAPEIPQTLRELVVDGAEGNPFYIEEIIKMLIDQKVIVPDIEQWRIEPARLAATRVPPTLTGVLQARLDGLTPLERTVLQRASVVGRVFWDTAVERLSCAPEPKQTGQSGFETTLTKRDILEALAGLRHKQLIFQRESSAFAGCIEYTFKHELLRNVTYESVLRKFRRDYHGRVATWLIDHSGERITEFTGLVASHFEQAARISEAADWYGRAGQQARLVYAPATAIDYFRKALELLPDQPDAPKDVQTKQLEWQEGLGETLGAQARFEEALKAYKDMLSLAEALGDLNAQARAWNGIAFLHERCGQNRASVESAERAERLARDAGETGQRERNKALYFKGWALYRLGDAQAVFELAEETLRAYTEWGDRRGMVTSFKLFGVAHLHLGHFREADQHFQNALSLCREIGDRRNAGAMWSNLGESARLRGDYRAAADHYQKAIGIVREIGNRDSESIYLNNLSGALIGQHQFAQAEKILRKLMSQTAVPNYVILSESYRFLSEACLGQGKLSEALDTAQRALSLAQESQNGLDLGGAWRALGRAAAKIKQQKTPQGSVEGASASPLPDPEACFSESLRVFQNMNAEAERGRTLRAWARFELAEGRVEQGHEKSDAAQKIFQRLGMPLAAERVDTWL